MAAVASLNIYGSPSVYRNYNAMIGKTQRAGYQSPVNLYGKNSSATSGAAKDYLTSIKKFSNELLSSVKELSAKYPPAFAQMMANASNTDTLKIKSVNSNAADPKKSTAVTVQQIATAQKNVGSSLQADGQAIGQGSYGFTLNAGGKQKDLSVNVLANDTTHDVQQKLANAINKSGMGINATVDYNEKTNTSSLILESAETGAKNSFSLTDKDGLIQALGVGEADTAAGDALFSVNGGYTRRSASNEVALGNGITAELKKASDKAVDVTLSPDTNKIISAMKGFAEDYNNLLKTAMSYNSTGSTKLSKQLTDAFSTYATQLGKAGLTQNLDGTLSVNEDLMKKSIADGSLEKAMGTSASNYGFLERLDRAASSAGSNPLQFLGTSQSNGFDMNSMLGLDAGSTGLGLLFDYLL